jgi:hypothetical protein
MCTTDDANGPSRGHQERRPTTVAGVVKTFTQTRTDLELYAEQGRRWQALELGATDPAQGRRALRRARGPGVVLVEQILALAEELKSGTIERMLAKSDLELGLEALGVKPPSPAAGGVTAQVLGYVTRAYQVTGE